MYRSMKSMQETGVLTALEGWYKSEGKINVLNFWTFRIFDERLRATLKLVIVPCLVRFAHVKSTFWSTLFSRPWTWILYWEWRIGQNVHKSKARGAQRTCTYGTCDPTQWRERRHENAVLGKVDRRTSWAKPEWKSLWFAFLSLFSLRGNKEWQP